MAVISALPGRSVNPGFNAEPLLRSWDESAADADDGEGDVLASSCRHVRVTSSDAGV